MKWELKKIQKKNLFSFFPRDIQQMIEHEREIWGHFNNKQWNKKRKKRLI